METPEDDQYVVTRIAGHRRAMGCPVQKQSDLLVLTHLVDDTGQVDGHAYETGTHTHRSRSG